MTEHEREMGEMTSAIKDVSRRVGAIEVKLDGLTSLMNSIEVASVHRQTLCFEKMAQHFVKKSEFWPIRAIVYGAVGVALYKYGGKLVDMAMATI